MQGDLVVRRDFIVPAADLAERFSRSSGPGGQGVNTTDSRVELSYDVARAASVPAHLRERLVSVLAGRLVDGVLTIAASEHRTQLANRKAARERLAQLLREAAAPPAPKATAHEADAWLAGTPARRQEAALPDQAGS